MDELEKLAKSKLKNPVGLRKEIKNNCYVDYKYKDYISTMEIWHGKLLRRTFAFKGVKDTKKILIKEVCRRLEGAKQILLCNIEYRYMEGNVVDFSEESSWTPKYSYKASKNNYWFEFGKEWYDVDEWINKLNVQYCQYKEYSKKYFMIFFKYYELYKKYPKIEFLVKAGLEHLVTCARYFNFKGKNFESIFKIASYWKPFIKQLNINDILNIRRYSIKNIDDLKAFNKFVKDYCFNYCDGKFVKKYFKLKTISYITTWSKFREYDDYLMMAEKIGYPLNENKYLYPQNLTEYHDKAVQEFNIEKNKEYELGFKKNADQSRKYNYEKGNLFIRAAEVPVELIEESANNHNCVRSYIERVSKNQTHIFFLRKTDSREKSFVTVEVKNKRLNQAFAIHNSPIDEESTSFLKDWCEKFKFDASLLGA